MTHLRSTLVCASLLALPFAGLRASAQSVPSQAAPSQATQNKPAAPAASISALPSGDVTMVVFSDFACPYSSSLFFTLEKLRQRYPDSLHIVFKQSPLEVHPEAPLAHRAALAAGRQGRFDAMAELLYSNQTRLSADALLSYARQLHLDLPRFRRDLDSPQTAAELAADIQESHGMGVDQTPTLFVNGKRMDGVQSEETLAAIMVKAVAAADAANASPLDSSATIDPALFAAMQVAPSASKGPLDAPLTIVEFTDFQCPFCRNAVPSMEQFVDAHGRQVRWVLHSFPLDFHLDSELANEAALAAGEQGKFWEMHDLIFAHQSAIKRNDLEGYAQQINLNMAAFDDALNTHRFAGRIAADRALGTRAGVNGTPTFIIDGHMITGARSLPELDQLLAQHLAAPTPGTQLAGQPSAAYATPLPTAVERTISGPAAAPVTLTWFTDVRSPLAARQAELIRSLTTRYEGRIRVQFRVFPVASRTDSRISSAALLAAFDQGKFWSMYDALASRRDVLDHTKLLDIGQSLQLDRAALASALDLADTKVTPDLDEAERRGVQGAPVIFLNAQRVDGLQREDFYATLVQAQLPKTPPAQASVAPASTPLAPRP